MVDPFDEYALQEFKDFDGEKMESTTKEGLDLGDDEDMKKRKKMKAKFEPLTNLKKEVLGVKVEKVSANDRTDNASCVLTTTTTSFSSLFSCAVVLSALATEKRYLVTSPKTHSESENNENANRNVALRCPKIF